MEYIARERPDVLQGLYARCCAEISEPQCAAGLH
jgi:hypothetical protein